MRPLDKYIREQLNGHLDEVGRQMDADVMSILSPILPGLDTRVRDAIEDYPDKQKSIAIILDTGGGVLEVVERMVECVRHFYDDMTVIVPDRAMSAGTIFTLNADRIMMDYYSCLGPIDPQIERDGKLVPALSYLTQFERLNAKATGGDLTTAEYALLSKLDLGELHQFEQARELSIELLIKWLSRYKFKDWKETETRKIAVTDKMKEDRAKEIADTLNDTERWHSHGRGIELKTLQNELKLKIEDYSNEPDLKKAVREYFDLLHDYMQREKMLSFVHTRTYF